MKKIVITLILLSVNLIVKAQDASVEKSIFGIQAGLFSIYTQYETKLSNSFSLRSELGLEPGVTISRDSADGRLFLSPVINLEPRWYYNLNKRQKKSKRIDNNSGNFVSLKTSFHPDWFTISSNSEKPIDFISDIVIIPTWGIRRNIGKKFNYEVGAGIAYVKRLEEFDSKYIDDNFFTLDFHLRIGYTF